MAIKLEVVEKSADTFHPTVRWFHNLETAQREMEKAVTRGAHQVRLTAKGADSKAAKYVVRLWDGFDGEWMDVSDPLPKEEAEALCEKKNRQRGGSVAGKETGDYGDIDYYAIFPADTTMLYSEGRSQTGRRD